MVEQPAAADVIRAAGGIPWRRLDDGTVEVLLVHRERYDDWSFPKGKLDPGESWEQAAVREVFEEAALVPVLGTELPGAAYRDRDGQPKQVRYWAMAVAVELPFAPGEEIAARRWVAVEQAEQLLSYHHDVDVLAGLVERLD